MGNEATISLAGKGYTVHQSLKSRLIVSDVSFTQIRLNGTRETWNLTENGAFKTAPLTAEDVYKMTGKRKEIYGYKRMSDGAFTLQAVIGSVTPLELEALAVIRFLYTIEQDSDKKKNLETVYKRAIETARYGTCWSDNKTLISELKTRKPTSNLPKPSPSEGPKN